CRHRHGRPERSHRAGAWRQRRRIEAGADAGRGRERSHACHSPVHGDAEGVGQGQRLPREGGRRHEESHLVVVQAQRLTRSHGPEHTMSRLTTVSAVRAVLSLLVLAMTSTAAHAQAWLPAKGEGTVSTLFTNTLSTRHYLPNVAYDRGHIDANTILFD